jgi:hexokinase
MFLGEILRLAVQDLMQKNVTMFNDENSSTNDRRSTTDVAETSGLLRPWGVDSSILSHAAGDHTPKLSVLRETLQEVLEINAPAYEDALAFKKVADAIGRRAARLAAVAIGGIVLQTGRLNNPEHKDEPVDIGVDGSLVENYPYFEDMIFEALRAIDGIGEAGAKRIRIGLAQDGSGVGAALIALVAERMSKAEKEQELLNNKGNADYVGGLRSDLKSIGEDATEDNEKAASD